MRFEEWKKEEKEEKPILVKMEIGSTFLRLNVINSIGGDESMSTLLEINEQGIILFRNIDPSIGLSLDSEGRLKIVRSA